jgi:hypothetical protein
VWTGLPARAVGTDLALSEVLELSGLDSLLELEQTLAGQGGFPAGGPPPSSRLFVSGF